MIVKLPSPSDCLQVYFGDVRCPYKYFLASAFTGQRTKKDQIGVGCSNPSKDVLKHIAITFFHYRALLPHVMCPSVTVDDYVSWLFAPSGDSVAGQGQLPNVLQLFEEALKKE